MKGATRTGSAALALVLLAASGCASSGARYADDAYGADSPEAVVQEFLEASVQDDYRAMARRFGTADGPAEVRIGATEVEQRMYVLAALLRHRSFNVRRSGLTEGEGRVRVLADLVGTRNGDVTVPVIVAESAGRWLVERVITDELTRRGR